MSRLFTYLMIVILGLSISCKKDDVVTEVPPFGILEYFGFTLVDVGWDDPTDSDNKTNYLDEVSDFSNIADILITAPSDNITDRLTQMDNAGVAGILNIYFLLFEQTMGTAPSGNKYHLRSDYVQRWNAFKSTNQLQSSQEKIAAFYIGEEPTWNGISAADLKAACDLVDSDFPNTPIMIIEAFPILDELVVPTSVDWVGFDQYFIKDPINDDRYRTSLLTLETKVTAEQHLVIVLDAHHYDAGHLNQGKLTLEEMKEVATNYYNMVSLQSRTVALLGYFWPNGFDDPDAIGARGMPAEIQNEYKRIGKAITGK